MNTFFPNLYKKICALEQIVCGTCMCMIVASVFLAAVTRAVGRPIQWAVDVSQFLLAWVAFLGADMGFRASKVIGVDLLTRKMPVKIQIMVRVATNLLILAVLLSFIYFGVKLSISNYLRKVNTLNISYSWITISLPVSCVMMSITVLISLKNDIQTLLGQTSLPNQEA